MNISADTKISELIKADPLTIEVLAGMNPKLAKLRNPLLRKVLASRVTIKDAASISGSTVVEFFSALEPLGFTCINADSESKREMQIPVSDQNHQATLDVRPILESNKDPFFRIMQELKLLEKGNSLLLINSFEPVPLYRILECKGYRCSSNKVDHVYHVTITKIADPEAIADNVQPVVISYRTLASIYKDRMVHLDVRGMEMPLPMITILETIGSLEKGMAIHVIHRKFPQFLVPELDERGFSLVHEVSTDGDHHLIIYRSNELS